MTKILVIEDDILIKNNVIDILTEESFQAIEASDGLMGVKLAQEHLPDLILCDVKMPSVDGYEVLKTLKKNRLTSWIPFIFLTSKTSRKSWRKGMELGADDYLTKPFTPRELLAAIATRISHSMTLRKYAEIRTHQLAEFKQIFDLNSTTNLPGRLSLQVKFEKLVRNHLLANTANLVKNKSLKLNIPIICLSIRNFAYLRQSLNDIHLKSLLKRIAERLQIDIFDRGIVSYLDRGVFAIILPSVDRRKDVIKVVNRTQQSLATPFDSEFNLSAKSLTTSAGISFYPQWGTNLHSAIEQARNTMQLVQPQSKSTYSFYKPNQFRNKECFRGFSLKKDVLAALDLAEFQVFYLPLAEDPRGTRGDEC